MVPLRQYGWKKAIAGYTTIEEVVRVTAADLELVEELVIAQMDGKSYQKEGVRKQSSTVRRALSQSQSRKLPPCTRRERRDGVNVA
jgi:hypothetical protein